MRWMTTSLLALAMVAPAAAAPGGYGPSPHRGGPGMGPGFGGPGGMPGGDPEMMLDRLSEHADRLADLLDLTDNQRTAFDRLKQDSLASARDKLEAMRANGDELRALLDGANPDPAAVGSKVIAMHQTRSELRDLRRSFEDGFSKLLTDEQRFAYDKLREARRFDGSRGPGMGHRFDRRSPPPDAGEN